MKETDKIESYYIPSVHNIGYLGKGTYTPIINKIVTPKYEYWRSMLRRCYDKKFQLRQPTYIGCTVCEEWLCFQTFAKWFDENYYECNEEKMQLDKDILYKGNKVYSPDTCVFVPKRINSLFVKRQNNRGKYPIGISDNKNCSTLRVRCSIVENGVLKSKFLGDFDTPEEAFNKGYKPFKERYIKQVANEYKDRIPQNLYEAMYIYVVEIDD